MFVVDISNSGEVCCVDWQVYWFQRIAIQLLYHYCKLEV